MHNGLITSLSLYPVKYLDEFLVPYGSSLETNILLASISSIFFDFLFYFTFFSSSKFTFFPLIFKKREKKKKKNHCNLGVHRVIYIFYCRLKINIFKKYWFD